MTLNLHTGQVVQLNDAKYGKRFRFLLEGKGIRSCYNDASGVKFDQSFDIPSFLIVMPISLHGVMKLREIESNAGPQ